MTTSRILKDGFRKTHAGQSCPARGFRVFRDQYTGFPEGSLSCDFQLVWIRLTPASGSGT